MYKINEGNNLDVKEDSFLDKLVSLNKMPKKLNLSSLLSSELKTSFNLAGIVEEGSGIFEDRKR